MLKTILLSAFIFIVVFQIVFSCEKNNPTVKLVTSKGEIIIELYPEKAPVTVKNFLSYIDAKFYDGTIFHRVIPGFMIQGGGFTEDMAQKQTKEPIKNEADNGLKNEPGTIAMARTNDPHSATCQFFINTVNNSFLNHTAKTARGWGYCVFGKVVKGMDVVSEIEGVSTGNKGPYQNLPNTAIVILKVEKL